MVVGGPWVLLLVMPACSHRVGSYAELAALPEVDVVYIGTLHAFHK